MAVPSLAPRSADQWAELIFNEMRLVRWLPDHEQVEETKALLARYRRELPVPYAQAQILTRAHFAGDDALLEHPEDCPRCAGSGRFDWDGKPRMCGCPAGEALLRQVNQPGRR